MVRLSKVYYSYYDQDLLFILSNSESFHTWEDPKHYFGKGTQIFRQDPTPLQFLIPQHHLKPSLKLGIFKMQTRNYII